MTHLRQILWNPFAQVNRCGKHLLGTCLARRALQHPLQEHIVLGLFDKQRQDSKAWHIVVVLCLVDELDLGWKGLSSNVVFGRGVDVHRHQIECSVAPRELVGLVGDEAEV